MSKIPGTLWMFGILAIISDLFAGTILFMMLAMPAQAFSCFTPFIGVTALLLLFLIISTVGVFKLKRWGRNIFVSLTLIMSCFLFWFFLFNLLLNILLSIYIISFTFYFLNPSTRKMFK